MKAILAVAVLAMAAFAGVMIVGDDTDATAGDGLGQYTVTYSVDGSSIVKKMDSGNEFTFQSAFEILPGYEPKEGKEFKGWKVDSSTTVYQISVPYAFTASVEVVPYEVDITASITLVYGDVEFEINAADAGSAIDNAAVVAKIGGDEGFAKKAGLTYEGSELKLAGYEFKGFLKTGATTPVAISEVSAAAHENAVFTAVFDKIYTVTFVANGMTIGTCYSNDFKQIEDPSIPNYTFVGWNVDGVRVSEIVAGEIVIPETYKIVKDTQFDAAFDPIQLTVTFQIGEKQITQTVLYNEAVMKPELPAGYVAWMYDGKEFDFNTPITAEITIVALEAAPIEPTTVYDITFEIADKTPVVQKSDSMVIPDTTLEGYVFQGWVVKNGAQYVDPVEYVKTITENVTFVAVYKLATESAFTVTFEIEGKSPITQKADSLTIPDTTREGYDFTGWVVKGSSDYVDPMTYAITADITFVAVYKAVEVVEFTVTFVNGDEVVDTVKVVKDALVDEIDAPEGMFWLFDFETPITADVTIEAKPLTVTVQFAVGEKVYNAYTQTVAYGEKIDVAKLADFIFPEGFDSWDYDFNEPVTADMTVYAKAIPEPEEVPPFFQTTEGKCVAVLIAVAIIALIYAVATNMFGLKDALTSFKVTRVKK